MKILGLDLGVGSIGWALIETDSKYNPKEILGIGSRLVPTDPKQTEDFKSGGSKVATPCAQRTALRTARKTNERYKMRREQLRDFLKANNISHNPAALNTLAPLELWRLRAIAVTEKIELEELGRVLMHICQKRGYRHSTNDSTDKKETVYVGNVNERYKKLRAEGLTIGQHFYKLLCESAKDISNSKSQVSFRIKDNVYPRAAYLEEAEAILKNQQKSYPELLSDGVIKEIINIIFFQRPLKSCKHLVSVCEFDKGIFKDANGNVFEGDLKVAPRTSPLAQVEKIWESINNIKLTNVHNRGKEENLPSGVETRNLRLYREEYELNNEERRKIFDHLNVNEKLTATLLFKILGLEKADGFKADEKTTNGLQGNTTYIQLKKALGDKYPELLIFDPKIEETDGQAFKVVSQSFVKEPMYQLWHTIYSTSNCDELRSGLSKKFGIDDEETLDALCKINFRKDGYSNKSAKFMRKLIPQLMEGKKYSEACEAVGVNHSDSMTKETNENRELVQHLPLLQKGELRQPIVEKIVNQTISLANALKDEYGEIDTVRIEFARELRQSKAQRETTTKQIKAREKENEEFAKLIDDEYKITPTKKSIQKYKLWRESGKCCIYCGQTVNFGGFISGTDAEIEHIIPRSVFFDDSFANRACACQKCNREKNNRTAYDFMLAKGEEEFTKYVKRVEGLFDKKIITKTKRDRLLTPGDKIPQDFLNRDLSLTQYIARKAADALRPAFRNVFASSGSVTDFFRHLWGYDNILHNLNIDDYALADLVEDVEVVYKGQKHIEKRITGWTKRLDHRHHAIDALTVALTRQSFVERLNRLNSYHDEMYNAVAGSPEFKDDQHVLEAWGKTRPHFSVDEVSKAVSGIAVSAKAGKRAANKGKRYVQKGGKRVLMQSGVLIPRGAMHEDSIYAKVRLAERQVTLAKAFEDVDNVAAPQIKALMQERLKQFDGNIKKAVASLQKNPLLPNKPSDIAEKDRLITMFTDHFVIRKDVASLKQKQIDGIIDKTIRQAVENRFSETGNNDKKYTASFSEKPLIHPGTGMPITRVRWDSGLKKESMVKVRTDVNGKVLGYAKAGNNHHIAFYRMPDGMVVESVVQFWTAVKRQKLGLPAIITDPAQAWEHLTNIEDSADVQTVTASLPPVDSEWLFNMQIGDMFILGMSDDQFNDAIASGNRAELCKHLYKVKKLSSGDYSFWRHTETKVEGSDIPNKQRNALRRVSSDGLQKLKPRKVKVALTGKIIYD